MRLISRLIDPNLEQAPLKASRVLTGPIKPDIFLARRSVHIVCSRSVTAPSRALLVRSRVLTVLTSSG